MLLVACESSCSESARPAGDAGVEGAVPGVCDRSVLYVSSRGDDTNDGCDPAKPRRTVTSALGYAQAKSGGKAEIRTCVETLRERVVLAGPASLIGGFDCATWSPGAGRTTFEAPSGDVVETMIAFGAPVGTEARMEHLRIVGPTRAAGEVSALRFTGGSSPSVKDVEVEGGTTGAGHSVTLGIEASSPSLEDVRVAGGRGACTSGCTGAYASGISINGGKPRMRAVRIEGGSAEVATTDNAAVGSVALDVQGDVKVAGAEAWSAIDVVAGTGDVGGSYPVLGVRVGFPADVRIEQLSVVGSSRPSTCKAATCFTVGTIAGGGALRMYRATVIAPDAVGAAGGTGASSNVRESAVSALAGMIEARSSFFQSPAGGIDILSDGVVDVAASTIVGTELVSNFGGTATVKSSILAHTVTSSAAFILAACPTTASTSIASSVILGSPRPFATFLAESSGACTGTGSFSSLSAAVAASSKITTFAATDVRRFASSCAEETSSTCTAVDACDPTGSEFVDACLGTVFATPQQPIELKDRVACSIAQGGLALADAASDLFGTPRTAAVSMGAHEYDGACSN